MKKMIIPSLLLALSMSALADQTLYLTFGERSNKVTIPSKLISDIQADSSLFLSCMAATSEVDENQVGSVDEDWNEEMPKVGAYVSVTIASFESSQFMVKTKSTTNDSRIAENTNITKQLSNVALYTELWKDGWGSGPSINVIGQNMVNSLIPQGEIIEFQETTIQEGYPDLNQIVDKGFTCFTFSLN